MGINDTRDVSKQSFVRCRIRRETETIIVNVYDGMRAKFPFPRIVNP